MRIEAERRENADSQRVAEPRTKDHNVAVGEIDKLQDTVDHRVAQRDKRVKAADGQSSDEGLNEVRHGWK